MSTLEGEGYVRFEVKRAMSASKWRGKAMSERRLCPIWRGRAMSSLGGRKVMSDKEGKSYVQSGGEGYVR